MSNEFDSFIRHSDFGKILELASILKEQKSQLVTIARANQEPGGDTAPSLSLRARKKKKSDLGESQVAQPSSARVGTIPAADAERPLSRRGDRQRSSYESAAELIRATLIQPAEGRPEAMADVMGRGECIITDSLVDETIRSLADELKLCLDLKRQLRAMSQQGTHISESSSGEGYMGTMKQAHPKTIVKTEGDGCGKGEGDTDDKVVNSIASKFSKWQTDLLTEWMIANREHPFPTQAEVHELALATNLTNTQVVNWTTNVRKRNLKATVERQKKPHHFLDYLFLATDREKKMRKEHPNHPSISMLDNMNMANNGFGYGGHRFAPSAPAPTSNHHSRGFPHPFVGHNPSNNVVPFQPSVYGHAPHPSYQHYPPPDIHHRRPVAPPKAPKNTDHIFRRGKNLGNLGPSGHDSRKVDSQSNAQLKQAKEQERRVLQKFAAPHDTPPGSYENEVMDDNIDEDMFDNQKVAAAETKAQPKTISFESSMSMPDAPFDEGAEDYLMRLLSQA